MHEIKTARIRQRLSTELILLLLGSAIVFSQELLPQPPPPLRYRFNVLTPMRDGVRLAANLYLPEKEGKYPVILIRTPYGKGREQQDALYFAARGYAVLVQDVRGRNDSDGEWYPWVNEGNDGYDTIEWAAKQPWSNGKVVTYGASYLGMDQWQAAGQDPPHLSAMVPIVAPADPYFGVFHPGGAFEYATMLTWNFINSRRTDLLPAIPLVKWPDVFRHLPISETAAFSGNETTYYHDWIEHNTRDAYWAKMSWSSAATKTHVPVFNVAGWFDIFHAGGLENYRNLMQHSPPDVRNAHRLLVGPWAHGGPTQKLGDVDFGRAAAVDMRAKVVLWLDRYVKGEWNRADYDPPIELFFLGANEWRPEKSWPPPGVIAQRLYLRSQGNAAGQHGSGRLTANPPISEPPDAYTFDPQNPVPTAGGATCCDPRLVPWGPVNQNPVETRSDVLVYTSEPLESDQTVAGDTEAHLFASSSARDTDWSVRLVDVAPDGTALKLTDGILRARFRDSYEDPKLLEPGKVYEFVIRLAPIAAVFKKGHRIRVDVTSSDFPRYSRNTNTGGIPELETRFQTAKQTIYHDRARSSYIVLPVLSYR